MYLQLPKKTNGTVIAVKQIKEKRNMKYFVSHFTKNMLKARHASAN